MAELSRNELLKAASAYLRGTIAEGLEAPLTGAIAEDDTQLTKFHGLYLQDDRDLRPERRKKLMEPAFAFMARVRLPGGVCTPQQWLQMDQIASDYANGTLRLTTRQTWQFHGVIKQNLRRTMQAIDQACLDTIAACGDVNRNVMCKPNPHVSQRPRRGAGAGARDQRASPAARRAPIARSGSRARRSSAASPRTSRSTARPICRESSRRSSPSRPTTTSTCSRTIWASSPSSTRPAASRAGTSPSAAAWA